MTAQKKFSQIVPSDRRASAYVFDYEREVADFYAAWPEGKDILFFEVEENSFSFVPGGHPEGKSLKTIFNPKACTGPEIPSSPPDRVKEKVLRSVDHVRRSFAVGLAARGLFGQKHIFLVAQGLLDKKLRARAFGLPGYDDPADRSLTDRRKVFVLDHEIGHLIARDGMSGEYLAESVADAFATIRHIQRFGKESQEVLAWERLKRQAGWFFFERDNGVHYTSTVMDKIIEDSEKVDFSALSLRDAVEVAGRYALQYSVYPLQSLRVSAEFRLAANLTPEQNIEKFADHVLDAACEPEAFEAGAAVLRGFLTDRLRLRDQAQALPVQQAPWRDIAARLAAREAAYEAEGSIFFGIVKKQPMAQNKNSHRPK